MSGAWWRATPACGSSATTWWGTGLTQRRTPYNGRNYEYISEDPMLTNRIGYGILQGCADKGILNGPKHMGFNDQEHNRGGISAYMNEQKFRETDLRGFEGGLSDADGMAVMIALNPHRRHQRLPPRGYAPDHPAGRVGLYRPHLHRHDEQYVLLQRRVHGHGGHHPGGRLRHRGQPHQPGRGRRGRHLALHLRGERQRGRGPGQPGPGEPEVPAVHLCQQRHPERVYRAGQHLVGHRPSRPSPTAAPPWPPSPAWPGSS